MTTPDPAETPATPTTPTDTAAAPAEADATTPPEASAETPPDDTTPNSEAAKYRRQLRDTESQLRTTSERLTGYQRRHAELAIADLLDTPADLFDIGLADLADFIDDDGNIRTDELRDAAATLIEQRPQLGANYQPPWPEGSDYGLGTRSQSTGGTSWASVLSDQRHRQ